ncbi:MAG: Fic family protein [Candidatus Babeliales bacterium]|jgi:Fic family protein
MEAILKRISEKKQRYDSYKPLHKDLEKNLYNWMRIALTYTSNAIEGNTLSFQETAQILEKNITVAGKSLTEHLEAINHSKAIELVAQKAKNTQRSDLVLNDILDIHRCILRNIDDHNAGAFRQCAVRVMGSRVPRPNYLKVPVLMEEFMAWLISSSGHVAKIAAEAHLKFVFIHPFVDGNGRTARLLLNLVLLQEGYPLTFVDQTKRMDYINAIEKALATEQSEDYYRVIFEAVEQSLDECLKTIEGEAVHN